MTGSPQASFYLRAGSSLGRKRRHSLRDQVSIDEVLATRIIGKKFPSEGCLAGTIWPRDDVKLHEVSIVPNLNAFVPD
jgi:hypothetical protein